MEGFVEFMFDENNMLVKMDTTTAVMSAKQQEWLLKKLPTELSEVETLLKNAKSAEFIEIIEGSVTFEMFWDKYNYKALSSKKKARDKWLKLNESDRQKAFNYINKYKSNINYGTAPKYAETYLNHEQWNN
jgi:hypothetical protein